MAAKKKAAAPKEQKSKKRKTPAYKSKLISGTVSDISGAISDLESLAEECREIVDNASEGLSETQRIKTFGETADALENVQEPEIPGCIAETCIDYTEMVPSRKGRGTSRSTRRDNAVSLLESARDAAQEFLDEEENAEHADRDEVQTFIDEVENIVSEVEGCEFPGMYG